jgi:hypothetical protein
MLRIQFTGVAGIQEFDTTDEDVFVRAMENGGIHESGKHVGDDYFRTESTTLTVKMLPDFQKRYINLRNVCWWEVV